jgi:D-arabinose 1-dehydrogenase-like Zn-dependent alcohol dehydrogenase
MDSPLPIALMLAKQIAVKAVLTGSREQQQAFIADLERYQIQPIISKTFAINNLQAAFAYQASQQHLGKIVLNHPVAAQ